jgi:hypothetical protein
MLVAFTGLPLGSLRIALLEFSSNSKLSFQFGNGQSLATFNPPVEEKLRTICSSFREFSGPFQ